MQCVVGTKAYLMAGQANDAWIAPPKHLNLRSATQPELFELVDMIGMAKNACDPGTMPYGQVF